ncbi:heavy-metal-associated domain-containing protein [Mycolicibacterium gadium]|nr:heavy-metal-associated domain-containing protein [Mycolicibacterium gadium]
MACMICAAYMRAIGTAVAVDGSIEQIILSATTFNVAEMRCGGCVRRVSGELSEIDGVRDVAVDLASGQVAVTSAAPMDQSAFRAAVESAGYPVAGSDAAT